MRIKILDYVYVINRDGNTWNLKDMRLFNQGYLVKFIGIYFGFYVNRWHKVV